MATIPMGKFGNRIAAPAQGVQVPQGSPVAGAIDQIAQTGQNQILQGIQDDRMQQEKQQRADAALALARTQNGLYDAADDITRRLGDGSLGAQDAEAEWSKLSSKVREDGLSGIQGEARQYAEAHLEQIGGTLSRGLGREIIKRRQSDTAATIDAFGEQVQREAARQGPQWAVEKFGAMVDFTADAAGLDEAKRAKLKQSFAERAHASYYQAAGTGYLTKGDADGLGSLVQKLQGPEGDALDPQRRQTLVHQLFGWQQSILAGRDREAAKLDTEARRRDDEARQKFERAWTVAQTGGFLSPDTITDLTQSAAGTSVEGAVVELIGSQREVAGFAGRAAPERAAILERLRARRATPGVGVSPEGDKVLSQLERMDGEIRQQINDNPWQAAQKSGRITDAQVFNAGDPQQAVQVIQQRMRQIGVVEEWAGRRVSPLQPQEVEQLGKMVRQLPVDQASSLLAGIGQAVGNAERVGALSKQLHDKDGSLGLAMMYSTAWTTEGRYTAELVLRGDQALRDNAAMVDKAGGTGWRAQIAKQIRGVFQIPEAEDSYIDAAYKIAAAKYVENGNVSIDSVVRLATGGIVERNGVRFPLPYGMNESDFNKRVEAIKPADLAAQAPDGRVYVGGQPMPLDQFVSSLGSASLVHAGQGLYNVRAGSRVVTDAQGKRITIKVGQ